MDTCTEEFARLAAQVGGLPCDGAAFVTLRSPFALDSWTQAVIELVLVTGAAAALWHALRWRRTTGDASNLVVWISGVVSLLLIEPIAYFPQWFGLEDELGLTFVHNQFTVQFLYDRLPLYIVALYPFFAYLAWALVQRAGILDIAHPVVAAVCVAFVFHCTYEVIDTVGVQFRWWVWNTELGTSEPSLGVVPLMNLQAFSLGLPFGMALIALLTRGLASRSRRGLALSVLAVSVLTWPIQFGFSVVWFVLHALGVGLVAARSVSTWAIVVTFALVTLLTVARTRSRGPTTQAPGGVFATRFAVVYLGVAAVLWCAALPDYLDASDGLTPAGAPTGSLVYAVATFVVSAAFVAGTRRRTTEEPRLAGWAC